MATPSLTRYWLVSEDDRELIQVQPNYIALNWRRRDDKSDYPGYKHMRARFLDLLRTAESGLAEHNGILQPTRVELTYINVIHPGGVWSSHADTHHLLRVALPEDASYERLSLSYSQALTNQESEFVGRLHVALNPTVDWIKQEPQIMLNLTVRSTDIAEQNIGSVLLFLDRAHDAVEEAFLNLTSDAAREAWGLK